MQPTEYMSFDESLYDQRFLMSIFSHLTNDFEKINALEVMEKGVVCLAIAALTSNVSSVWNAGAHLLQSAVEMIQKSK